MADVVVVGAGLAGLAVSARLAKLGHRVTVLEREPAAGGRFRTVERDGFAWDAQASSTALPAVLRDLFRKSGRPIERYLDLKLRTPTRRHVFEDGAVVDLPTGSRARQIGAVDAGLGRGRGRCWADFVDSQAAVWDVIRRSPIGPDGPADPLGRGGRPGGAPRWTPPGRGSVDRLLPRALPDERLRAMVAYRFVMAGSAPSRVPAYCAVSAYVERSFGVWTSPSGAGGLVGALVTRLRERQVDMRYGTDVTEIATKATGVIGVVLGGGELVPADVVVAANDPLSVFAELLPRRGAQGARVFASAILAGTPAVTHLGLRHDNPDGLPAEVVLHGDPLIALETDGAAPAGHRAWTVRLRGRSSEDVLALMAGRGVDVRGEVVSRVEASPGPLGPRTGATGHGLAWDSLRALRRRSTFAHPLPGLHVLAAPLTPDAAIPEVCWTAARVANRIGKASPAHT